MRRFIVWGILFVVTVGFLFIPACSRSDKVDRLAYQMLNLYIEADFRINNEEYPLKITLDAPEFDSNGKMLPRTATITFSDNSILSGISYSYISGKLYLSSEDLKIPIDNEDVIMAINNIISLFSIREQCYHSSEKIKYNNIECEKSYFVSGNNNVELILDLTCNLPISIKANIDNKELNADIKLIKAK